MHHVIFIETTLHFPQVCCCGSEQKIGRAIFLPLESSHKHASLSYLPFPELGQPDLIDVHLAAQVILRVGEDAHRRLRLADLLVVADEVLDACLGVRGELQLLNRRRQRVRSKVIGKETRKGKKERERKTRR